MIRDAWADELIISTQHDNILYHEQRKKEREDSSLQEEEMGPMQKQRPAADVTGDGSQVQRCKEQYCTGTWNVRSVNQGKLEVVKQEMARVNRHFRNQ